MLDVKSVQQRLATLAVQFRDYLELSRKSSMTRADRRRIADAEKELARIIEPEERSDLLVNVSTVADFYGITVRQVQNWVRQMGCPKLRHGLYDLKTVHAWWMEHILDRDSKESMDAKKKYWTWKAEDERLKVEQKAGKLVDVEGVKRAAFTEGRRVRDAILNVPARISAQLAVMRDQFEVEQYLTAELKQSLRTLSSERPADDSP